MGQPKEPKFGRPQQPLNGFAHLALPSSSVAGLRQARLEVEGNALTYWNFKIQYDFTASNTTSIGAIGGIRDAYIALRYFDSVTFQLGQLFEPMGLEQTTSKNYSDFIEKSMAGEAFAPGHHIGFAALTHGSAWSIKGGVFTTSLLEKSLTPSASTPVPLQIPSQANWVATGGGQYFDVTGRVAYAPVMTEDRLLHLGLSGRYHQPNDSAADNDRVLAPGSNIKTESNILNETLLGTPDLSCGEVAVAGNPPVAGKCVKNVLGYGAEFAAAYGPFSLQSEYFGARYNRNNSAILAANAAGIYAPGGSSLYFDGYYVDGAWYLTGESRAGAYKVAGLNPSTFGQIDIKNPLSAGGAGAWELGVRFSAVNLNKALIALLVDMVPFRLPRGSWR
jgi:phosphate-selective porin OprO/OprP